MKDEQIRELNSEIYDKVMEVLLEIKNHHNLTEKQFLCAQYTALFIIINQTCIACGLNKLETLATLSDGINVMFDDLSADYIEAAQAEFLQ